MFLEKNNETPLYKLLKVEDEYLLKLSKDNLVLFLGLYAERNQLEKVTTRLKDLILKNQVET